MKFSVPFVLLIAAVSTLPHPEAGAPAKAAAPAGKSTANSAKNRKIPAVKVEELKAGAESGPPGRNAPAVRYRVHGYCELDGLCYGWGPVQYQIVESRQVEYVARTTVCDHYPRDTPCSFDMSCLQTRG